MAQRYLQKGTVAKFDATGSKLSDYTAWADGSNYDYDDIVKGKTGGSSADKVFRCILANEGDDTATSGNEPGVTGNMANRYWVEAFAGFITGFQNYTLNEEAQEIDASSMYDDVSLQEKDTNTGSFTYIVERGGGVVQKLLVPGAEGILTVYHGGQVTGNEVETAQIQLGGTTTSSSRGQVHMRQITFSVTGDVQRTYSS